MPSARSARRVGGDLSATVLGPAEELPGSAAGRCRSGRRPRVERCAPTAAGRYREFGSGHAGSGRDCYQGTECRTVRWLRHRAVFMRPSPDGAGAIMSLCARRAGVLAGRACCRTGLLAGGAARAGPRARPHELLRSTRCGPGVLRTRGTARGAGRWDRGHMPQDSPMRASGLPGRDLEHRARRDQVRIRNHVTISLIDGFPL
ncbi:MAG: hypothetical protein ACJAQ3_003810 [Planctomycetota bacterium]|jgi:hypothetical protein